MSADVLEARFEVDLPGFRLAVDEAIALSGVTAVFGPSGGGKSTLLRAIAGFERPSRGRIVHAGSIWFDVDGNTHVAPHRRPVGFMFQDARLFSHLNVAGNLGYAEKRNRTAPGFGRQAVVEALDLAPLLERRVTTLSGGERQRVALGRTLLRGPRLLLLDEPLAALDRGRKAEILPYLERIPQQFHVPTLYVSHDIDEVAALADRMLVLVDGRVQLHDGAAAAFARLDLQPLTGRFEAGVVLEGRVAAHDRRLHLTHLDVGGDELTMPLTERPPGATLRVRVRARDVALAVGRPEGLSIRNVLPGTVTELVDVSPGFVEAVVRLRSVQVRVRITLAAVEALGLESGSEVFALIKSVSFEGD